MKKIIALVLALSLLATMVFAEPVALASGLIQTTDLISEADPDNSLFADIGAPQLAALEADAVEGGVIGPWGVAAIIVGGALVVAAVYAGYRSYSITFFAPGR
jgi:hypothetical protein